jgi:hypothetical protein
VERLRRDLKQLLNAEIERLESRYQEERERVDTFETTLHNNAVKMRTLGAADEELRNEMVRPGP